LPFNQRQNGKNGEGYTGSKPSIVTAICQGRIPVQRDRVYGWGSGSLSGDEKLREATSAAF